MAKCKVCEYCGANLDYGEPCDCGGNSCRQDGADRYEGGVTADGAEER